MTAITRKLGRLEKAERLLRELEWQANGRDDTIEVCGVRCGAAHDCGTPNNEREHYHGCELDAFLAGGGGVDTNLHLYNDLELSQLEIAKLQKRAGEWEQKDVVAFEKTIADLREKLTAAEREAEATTLGLQLAHLEERIADREDFGSRVYGSRRHWKGRAGRAERELESYAATDRTASLALVDVTRERDEAREKLAAAETLAEQRRVELKVHKQFTKQYNAAVERERDEARVSLASLRELVHQEECCEGTWDSDVDHYGCCEALRCSLGETGGDDSKTQEEADAKWNTRG